MSLADELRRLKTNALIADAELIRNWPNPEERMEQAQRHIRRAMYLFALGRGTRQDPWINQSISITLEELHRIHQILDFAYDKMKFAQPSSVDIWNGLSAFE